MDVKCAPRRSDPWWCDVHDSQWDLNSRVCEAVRKGVYTIPSEGVRSGRTDATEAAAERRSR